MAVTAWLFTLHQTFWSLVAAGAVGWSLEAAAEALVDLPALWLLLKDRLSLWLLSRCYQEAGLPPPVGLMTLPTEIKECILQQLQVRPWCIYMQGTGRLLVFPSGRSECICAPGKVLNMLVRV